MLGKCANPPCPASFRYLEQGQLFRLETDPALRSPNTTTVEHFWLCPSCSAAMTLRISKEGKVIPVALPAPVHGDPNGSDFISANPQKGLLLRGVSFSTERHRGGAGFVG
jgi:hypothetical protein